MSYLIRLLARSLSAVILTQIIVYWLMDYKIPGKDGLMMVPIYALIIFVIQAYMED